MQNGNEVPDIDWSHNRLLPGFQTPEHLDVYDIGGTSRDEQLAIATLVGLINRPQPRVYLLARQDDAFWLQECFQAIPTTLSPLRGRDILTFLLTTYRQKIEGFILYDPQLEDSINIATMLASQRNGVVVSPLLAQQLQEQTFQLPILADLRAYAWKNRLQAYQWAYTHLLKTASPRLMTGMSPAISVGIRPFLVATNSFIYWLDPRNILPNFSAGGMSEFCLMRKILAAFPPRTAHMGWFLHEGMGTALASLAAHPVFASDFATNLEVWASVPATFAQQAPERKDIPPYDPHKTYVSFTFSEGDNLQYNQEHMLHLWRDPMRGSISVGWAIAPALAEIAPTMAIYYMRTATAQDEFIAGPSGAGYMYPSFWPTRQLPAFLERTGNLMQRMHLQTLEVLDLNIFQSLSLSLRAIFTGAGLALIDKDRQRRFAQGLAHFHIRGILSGGGQSRASWKRIDGMPIYQNVGIAKNISQAIALIKAASTGTQRQRFINLYILAWTMTPSDLKQVAEQLGDEYEVVTPGTLLAMLPES